MLYIPPYAPDAVNERLAELIYGLQRNKDFGPKKGHRWERVEFGALKAHPYRRPDGKTGLGALCLDCGYLTHEGEDITKLKGCYIYADDYRGQDWLAVLTLKEWKGEISLRRFDHGTWHCMLLKDVNHYGVGLSSTLAAAISMAWMDAARQGLVEPPNA